MKKFFAIVALVSAFIPALQGVENFRFSQRSQFAQAAPSKKTTRKKEFICPRCDTAFLSQKNLDAHNEYSYCGKKAKAASDNA